MRRNIFASFVLLVLILVQVACTSSDPFDDSGWTNNWNNEISGGSTNTSSIAATGSLKELLNLDVVINKETLLETETLPSSSDEFYEDYAELSDGFSEKYVVKVAYSGTSATVTGNTEAVSVATGTNLSDVVITSKVAGVHYVLSGTTTDGSFKIYSTKKFELELNGVNITNPTGAAINNQGKRAYVVLTGESTLTDGTTYSDKSSDEDMKGTFFSEGKLAFSGTGTLNVYSKGKHGIACDDYILFRPGVNIYVNSTSGNAIKSNDGIIIRGGVINVETSATASKGISTDGMFLMEGGRTTAITSGNGEYDADEKDVSGAAGVKADSIIVISGGELLAKSTGKGGKGISTDQTFTIIGGTVKVVTTGNTYTYSNSLDSKAKGIKADGNMTVKGGLILAKTTGGDGCEGIETKGTYTQDAGSIAIYAYDDALNSAKTMTINGGYLYGYSTGNDGIDSNGNLTVNGGVVIGCGTMAPEEGIDAAEGCTFSINGGVVIGIGGGGESVSGTQQKTAVSGVSIASGNYLTVGDGSTTYFALQMPCSYSGATLQLSCPSFESGTSYTLGYATAVTGDNDFYGYVSQPTLTGTTGTMTSSLTTSSTLNGSTSGGMQGGGMGGGNQGGMGGGRH